MDFIELQKVLNPEAPLHFQKKDVATFINTDYILLLTEHEMQGRHLVAIETETGEKFFVSNFLNNIKNKLKNNKFLTLDLLGSSKGFLETPLKVVVNFNFVIKFAPTNMDIAKKLENYTSHKFSGISMCTIELKTKEEIIVKATRDELYYRITGKHFR